MAGAGDGKDVVVDGGGAATASALSLGGAHPVEVRSQVRSHSISAAIASTMNS
jgi:hypothetical protein